MGLAGCLLEKKMKRRGRSGGWRGEVLRRERRMGWCGVNGDDEKRCSSGGEGKRNGEKERERGEKRSAAWLPCSGSLVGREEELRRRHSWWWSLPEVVTGERRERRWF
ncbi:hypothetical protein HAX54_019401 [Datura stramonium]|uniref:Uncharacterized protein n=1 Tax=Datura stramonium TaxID=4076 RepID=A0ABS8S1Y4_DATST|nr:hypothetical protein [Datura stramonium]